MVECIWEGCVVITGLWRGLVVSDGLNALPQAPCISAVCEMIIDFIYIYIYIYIYIEVYISL